MFETVGAALPRVSSCVLVVAVADWIEEEEEAVHRAEIGAFDIFSQVYFDVDTLQLKVTAGPMRGVFGLAKILVSQVSSGGWW